jgi:DNA-binding transcriptional LysR family regulator
MSQLEGIEYFVRTVEAGSFAAAARRLGVTPSAVSRQVAHLEEELGVPLLARTTRSLSLTHDGQAFHARCLRVIEELTEARDALARVRKKPAGVLRVDAPSALGRRVLAARLPEFLERYPDIDVELMLRDQLVDPFVEGSDVLLRIGALRDSALIARRLGESRLVMCGAPSYLKKRGVPKKPADLARHECLSYLRADGRQPWRLRSNDQPLEVFPVGSLQVNDAETLVTHALAGRGLVVVFDFLVAEALRTGQLVAVLARYAPPAWPIHALYPKNRHLVPKVGVFLDFLAKVFK